MCFKVSFIQYREGLFCMTTVIEYVQCLDFYDCFTFTRHAQSTFKLYIHQLTITFHFTKNLPW